MKLLSKRNNLVILIFLFKTGLSHLMSNLSLISIIYLWCLYANMVNSSKDGILLQVMRWNCTLFWWFNFPKYQGWHLNMFSWRNFQVSIRLTIIGRIASSTLNSYTTLETPSRKVSNLSIVKDFLTQCEAYINSKYHWKISLIKFLFVRKYLLGMVMTKLKSPSQLPLSEDASWPTY